ncbi:sulfotransferase domain-containing protein [Roseofilum sp. BLCC_M154]|uniref:Sulfotransferase domain-containing protein n=1 Tax=Roseofilum acuticapitatum BLCC-M154 TaxID=3022444 RepID=A0ABT7AXT2_9CYAN|nr:sulfotransferase domain-containing protein [Roseofilum acuticapitatum]MDJ1170873.1 sulfotransferase domain-containing protein [Roseofilum acuticapitatum BLCC-M154]
MVDYLIIGAQKSGTTSLYHHLIEHPGIGSATEKELHFFSLHFDRGVSWYEAQFPQPGMRGEASPYYLYHPLAPQRVHQCYPNVKLIVLLRDPVKRAISHYYHEVRWGFETLGLEEAIASEPQRLQGEVAKIQANPLYHSFNHRHYSYLDRGLYLDQLLRWYEYFPSEQFLILLAEDFYSHPQAIANQVYEFLELPPHDLTETPIYDAGDYPNISPQLYQQLADYFTPHNQRLSVYLRQPLPWTMTKPSSPIDYEGAWDNYAQNWTSTAPDYQHVGDEWIGKQAGAASSLSEYEQLIETHLIAPYIQSGDRVLEIGIGGGKTAALLLNYCQELVCADISAQMLKATQERLGTERTSYVKLNGLTLDGIQPGSIDVCFCYDTMVHIEPRDIYNYLAQIPPLLRGRRLCLFHHSNILSPLGWEKFLNDYPHNLLGKRDGTAFSIMTNEIMEKFLTTLGYEILEQNTELVPRDCIWICRAPEDKIKSE